MYIVEQGHDNALRDRILLREVILPPLIFANCLSIEIQGPSGVFGESSWASHSHCCDDTKGNLVGRACVCSPFVDALESSSIRISLRARSFPSI